jgi:hypothetical protein
MLVATHLSTAPRLSTRRPDSSASPARWLAELLRASRLTVGASRAHPLGPNLGHYGLNPATLPAHSRTMRDGGARADRRWHQRSSTARIREDSGDRRHARHRLGLPLDRTNPSNRCDHHVDSSANSQHGTLWAPLKGLSGAVRDGEEAVTDLILNKMRGWLNAPECATPSAALFSR